MIHINDLDSLAKDDAIPARPAIVFHHGNPLLIRSAQQLHSDAAMEGDRRAVRGRRDRLDLAAARRLGKGDKVIVEPPGQPTLAMGITHRQQMDVADGLCLGEEPEQIGTLEEFQAGGYPLARVAPPTLGVKTGADGVFVGQIVEVLGDDALVAFADSQSVIERKQLRPVLRGRDIRHFAVCPTRVIVWCLDPAGNPLERLSDKASQHFALHAQRLRARSDYQNGPVWTVFRTRGALADHRVVWPDIARRPRAIVLEETETVSAVPLNTCYVAPAPDRETSLVIAAVLNSTWSAAFATAHGDEARGHYRRINARLANRIPIPRPGSARAELAELSRRAHRNEDVRNEDLDEAVAVALGLSSRAQRALQSLAKNNG